MQINAEQLGLLVCDPVPVADERKQIGTDTSLYHSDVSEWDGEWYINQGDDVPLTAILRDAPGPVSEGDADDAPQEAPESALLRLPDTVPVDVPSDGSYAGTPKPSGYEIALDNEIELLEMLWKYHWLTSRQLAMLLFFSVEMVRRTLRRMRGKGRREIARVRLPNGIWAYFLAKRGAARLRDKTGVPAKAIRLRNFGNWRHRVVCNYCTILIYRKAIALRKWDQIELYSEYEIETGRAPLSSWGGKVPDGLLVKANQGGYGSLAWIEVENTRRNGAGKKQLADFLLDREENHIDDGRRLIFARLYLFGTQRELLIEVCRDIRRQLKRKGVRGKRLRDLEMRVEIFQFDMSPGLILGKQHYFGDSMADFYPETDD